LEVQKDATKLLVPLILVVLQTIVNSLYLEMPHANTALSETKISAAQVMSVKLRPVLLRLKDTALLEPQAAVKVKQLLLHALLIKLVKSLVKTRQFVLMSHARVLVSAKLCTAQCPLLELKFVHSVQKVIVLLDTYVISPQVFARMDALLRSLPLSARLVHTVAWT